MTAILELVQIEAPAARPVARWVEETDDGGRRRLVMRWSVPEPTIR